MSFINFQSDSKNKKIFLHIKELEERTERSLRQSFYRIGKQLTKEARRSIIKGPKTGKLYRIPGRKRKHRASAPGEPPANLTGALQKSVDFIVKGSRQLDFGAGDFNVDYAGYLELGTDKMAKRPYLIKAINEKEKQIDSIFNGELRKNLDRL